MTLDSSDYFSGFQAFQNLNSETYYSVQKGKSIKLFQVKGTSDSSWFDLTLNVGEFFKSFIVDNEFENIYFLLQKSLLKFPLSNNNIYNSSEAIGSVNLTEAYDNLYFESGKILLTRCYNEASVELDYSKSRVLLINPSDFTTERKLEFEHDAIGLTHLASYYFDCNYGKLLFVNGLSDKFEIVSLNNNYHWAVGSDKELNSGVDSIPFKTQIMPYSNAKEIVSNISKFASKINYFEGGSFLNDSTFFVVQKTKGNYNSKRILWFYKLNQLTNEWMLVTKRNFYNPNINADYLIFQFYNSNGIDVKDNIISIVEYAIPNGIKSMKKINQLIDKDENPHFKIYNFKLVL
jgi:hypothetical protein